MTVDGTSASNWHAASMLAAGTGRDRWKRSYRQRCGLLHELFLKRDLGGRDPVKGPSLASFETGAAIPGKRRQSRLQQSSGKSADDHATHIEAFRFPRIKARPSFDRRVSPSLYASNQMRAGACGSRRCCADQREHRDLESHESWADPATLTWGRVWRGPLSGRANVRRLPRMHGRNLAICRRWSTAKKQGARVADLSTACEVENAHDRRNT
jgi:hypothetical protein